MSYSAALPRVVTWLPICKFFKFWFPENDNGAPQMEIISPEGANLNEDTTYNIFYNIFLDTYCCRMYIAF